MSFYLRTNYIWKHGRHGWSYDLESESGTENTYRLASSRRDRYSYLELSLTRRFKQKYSWLVSYARSSARSSAVIDFSLDNPMIGRQGSGRMGWDAPNRFISWAAFPAPVFSKYLLSYFVEWHSGFPFSAVNEIQQLVGTPNSHEFPEFFSANFFVERRFRFLRFEWAFRAGCNNVAGRRNPVVVNNDIDSGEFGQFRGGQARVFAGRIRLLGRT